MRNPEKTTTIERKPNNDNGHPIKIITGKKNCAILRIEDEFVHKLLESLENKKRYSEFVILSPFTKDGIKLKYHREIPKDAILIQATVSRLNNQYFISILVDDNIPIPKPIKAKNAVGLDVGITHLLITSDGVKYPNKKYTIKSQAKLKKLQKRV